MIFGRRLGLLTLLPTNIAGVTGQNETSEIWHKHFYDIFNCVKSKAFDIDNVLYSESVIVRLDEVQDAIET